MTKRYARNTKVGVAKSRNEIDQILRRWGADQLQWSEDVKNGRSMLRFVWTHEDTPYCAQFVVKVPSAEEIKEESVDGRTGGFSQTKYDKAMKQRGTVEHRELALLLKAMFVAVEAELISAEQILLPFLEDASGQTIADIVLPNMSKILQRGGVKQLLTKNP
jgi:hypothetical protein